MEFFDNKKNLEQHHPFFKAVYQSRASDGMVPWTCCGFRALCLNFYTHPLLKTSRWIKPDSPKGLYHVIGLCALYSSCEPVFTDFRGPREVAPLARLVMLHWTFNTSFCIQTDISHTNLIDTVNSKSKIFNELAVSFIYSFFISFVSVCFIRHSQNGAK